jgi:L-lactate dehydrogenase
MLLGTIVWLMEFDTSISKGKVAIIGAGYVGASITYALTIKGLAREIVLIEHSEATEKCLAEINDIRHGISQIGSSNIYSGNYSDIKNCDLIILSAGRNRRQNETRLEMITDNIQITSQIASEINKYYTRGIIVVVTNPVDIITHAMTKWMALPDGTVFGTGCVLDSSRLTNVIADHIGISADVINAHVIGEHGDGQIALWSKVAIAGIPVKEYCSITAIPFTEDTKIMMEDRVRHMGSAIIKGKGRTHYGIATCVCYIADAILNHHPTIASVSSVLHGEYGIADVALSLPSIIDSTGIERRLTYNLEEIELLKLNSTAALLRSIRINKT